MPVRKKSLNCHKTLGLMLYIHYTTGPDRL